MHAIARLKCAFGRARSWLSPRALVLVYHRVADLPSDPFGLCVKPRAFAEHMEVLRSLARPIPLGELARSLSGHKVTRRAVVVTFDDGYADNLLEAKPLLEKFDVPATVFIATGYVGRGREFWWDELESVLFRPGPCLRIPPSLARAGGSVGLDRGGNFSVADAIHHRSWKYSDAEPRDARHALFCDLYLRLKGMHPDVRDLALEDMHRAAGIDPGVRPEYRALTQEELARMADGTIIEAGAHTVNHPLLPTLQGPERRREIVDSKEWLEETLGRRVEDFSYPHGGIDAETAGYVHEAGFRSASTTRAARLTGWDAPVYLPRVVPEGEDGDGFAKFLRTWLSDEPRKKLAIPEQTDKKRDSSLNTTEGFAGDNPFCS